MPQPCPQYDLRSELTNAAWSAHRDGCASCREQWAVELELRRAFAPPPVLSSGFEQALHRRLQSERPARVDHPRGLRRFLMPAYWLAAAAVSLVIVHGIEWPGGAEPAAMLLLSALTLAVPILLLSRQFGLSLYELVFISASRRPVDQIPPLLRLGHPTALRGGS